MRQLVIVQPYIPSYRLSFFDRLHDRLAREGVSLVVAAGSPSGDQAARGDGVTANYEIRIDNRYLHLAGSSLNLGGSTKSWKQADAVILGLEGTSFDLYRALIKRSCSSLRVGVWGHIGSFVKPPNKLDLALERWQMKHSDHIFAYTPRGAQLAQSAGVPRRRITTVMNAVDTSSLSTAHEEAAQKGVSIEGIINNPPVVASRYLGYIGALDESKRIRFLSESLEVLWKTHPEVKVLIAGRGPLEGLLRTAINRGQVYLLGYADNRMKAELAQVVEAFIMPGRVGLVAVETLLLQKPLLTTNWAFHSVEIDYLTEGTTKFTAEDDPGSFARLMGRRFTEDQDQTNFDLEDWRYPTLEDMVSNFADGVHRMFAA